MHSHQHRRHYCQICKLILYNVPGIRRKRNVYVHIGQQTERIHYQPHVYPHSEQHNYYYHCHKVVFFEVSLKVEPSSSQKYITSVMHDQDHHPHRDLVTHHRKQNQTASHAVVHHPLVKLPLLLPTDRHQLKDRKQMHPQMKHKIDLHFGPLRRWPVRVLFVDFGAGALTSSCRWKPILGGEQDVANDGRSGVEYGVIAELEEHFDFPDFFFA